MNNQLKVEERTYSFGIIPPVESVYVQAAIARVIGEPLFKALTAEEGADANELKAGSMAVGLMLSKLDADELLKTMGAVFKYVSVDGKRCEMNTHFVGRNKEMWQVFIYGLRFNFRDFLPENLLASFPDIAKKLNLSRQRT